MGTLRKAAAAGRLHDVQRLVRGGAGVDARDHRVGGETPLMCSAERGHLSVAQLLVDHGAALEETNAEGRTPLMFAASGGNVNVVQFLLERGARVDAEDGQGRSPLMWSCKNGHVAAAKMLIEQGEAVVDASDHKGWTAAMHGAAHGHVKIVQYLLDHGADVTTAGEDGATLLMLLTDSSAKMRKTDADLLPLVGLLLDKGADPTYSGGKKRSALSIAKAASSFGRIVDLMLQYVLHAAAWQNELESLELAINEGAVVDAKDKAGRTALMLAADEDHAQVARVLIDNGATLDAKDSDGRTALMYAAARGQMDVVEILVDEGAELDAKDSDRRTALMRAAENGQMGVVRFLIDNGASPDMNNQYGTQAPHSRALPTVSQLGSTESVAQMLAFPSIDKLSGMCGAMYEAESMCRHLIARLDHLVQNGNNGRVWRVAASGQVISVDMVVNRTATFLKERRDKPVVFRLIGAPSIADAVAIIHGSIDELEGHNQPKWRAQWAQDVTSMKEQVALRMEKRLPHLAEDLTDSRLQTEALTLLVHETKHNDNMYTPDELDLRWTVLSHIIGFSTVAVPDVEDWFIPRHELLFDSDEPFARGHFGDIHRAVWKGSNVVVKFIELTSEAEKRALLDELKRWHQARHRHLVPVFGACHLESPLFIVCEYVAGGSLVDYLSKQRAAGSSVVWRKLYDVASGLSALHKESIVHGDLKGSNVLIAKDGRAMLTNFGLRFLQSSHQSQMEKWGEIRWQAPEQLDQNRSEPSFVADIYSLGMCIVEAVTGEVPWGTGIADVEVKACLQRREMLRRPSCMSEDEWALVAAMCAIDPSERLRLDEVVRRLSQFASEEQAGKRHCLGCPAVAH